MSASNLDPHQILKRVFDQAGEALSVKLPDNTSISLNKDEDSITIVGTTSSGSLDSSASPVATTVVIAPESAVGYNTFSLYSTGYATGVFALEVAADDAATVWFEAVTLNVESATAVSFVGAARRVRVIVKTDIVGTGTVALVAGV